MSERQWQERLVAFCAYLHLRTYHNPDSRRSTSGFPDLVILGPGGVIFAELKTDTGRVSADQRGWVAAFAQAGITMEVWRPRDWPDIEERLRRLAKP